MNAHQKLYYCYTIMSQMRKNITELGWRRDPKRVNVVPRLIEIFVLIIRDFTNDFKVCHSTVNKCVILRLVPWSGHWSIEVGGPRGRAREKFPHHLAQRRTTRSRVPPTVASGNRSRPNGPRARRHESRPLALSRRGSSRCTLLAVCPPSPPRPPSPRQASPPTSAEGRTSPLALPLHDWSLHSGERSHVMGPLPH